MCMAAISESSSAKMLLRTTVWEAVWVTMPSSMMKVPLTGGSLSKRLFVLKAEV